MTTSGCNLSFPIGRKRFRDKIVLVWRVEEDLLGVPSGRIPTEHIQKNVTVSPVRYI